MKTQYLQRVTLDRIDQAERYGGLRGWRRARDGGRLQRVFYPPLAAANERIELVQVNSNGTVAIVEWVDDEPV